jgi:homoserine dehydrogenase
MCCRRHYRLWTRGYDVYTPNKVAVAHDYYDVMPGAEQNVAKVRAGAVLFFLASNLGAVWVLCVLVIRLVRAR